MVSGSVSPSCPECFSPFPHGTGTLSVSRECLALPDGPGGFAQDYTCPALLRVPLCPQELRVRGCHPLRPDFPVRSARACKYNRAALLPPDGLDRPGLGSSPFARHYWGNHCCFLFLRVLRCFSSPRSPHASGMMTAERLPGCPIRRSADHRPFAPTRGFSQLTTSFVASVSLGIHHAPLLSFPSLEILLSSTHPPLTDGCASSFCLACANMSKILRPKKGKWRITDSNR